MTAGFTVSLPSSPCAFLEHSACTKLALSKQSLSACSLPTQQLPVLVQDGAPCLPSARVQPGDLLSGPLCPPQRTTGPFTSGGATSGHSHCRNSHSFIRSLIRLYQVLAVKQHCSSSWQGGHKAATTEL